jgi:hypothetical protein
VGKLKRVKRASEFEPETHYIYSGFKISLRSDKPRKGRGGDRDSTQGGPRALRSFANSRRKKVLWSIMFYVMQLE